MQGGARLRVRGGKNVEIIIRGELKELAALVRATEKQQTGGDFITLDELKKSVTQTVKFSRDIKRLADSLRASGDTGPNTPGKLSN